MAAGKPVFGPSSQILYLRPAKEEYTNGKKVIIGAVHGMLRSVRF